jgi:hypothetical protein
MRKAKRSAHRVIVISPKHRRRHVRHNPKHHRRYHRNPAFGKRIRSIASKRNLMTFVSYGAGVAAGMLTPTLLSMIVPVQYRKFYGIGSIVLAGVLYGMMKNPNVKQAALVMGGFGVYDLLTQNIAGTGLPVLTSNISPFGLKLPHQAMSYSPARPNTVMGLSYSPAGSNRMAASYSKAGATNPYENLVM